MHVQQLFRTWFICFLLKFSNYFFKFLKDTGPFSWATDTPVFGLLVMFALGFKVRVDPFLHAFLCCAILRFTSDATSAECLRGQHASGTSLIHVLVDLSISIGGDSNFIPANLMLKTKLLWWKPKQGFLHVTDDYKRRPVRKVCKKD